MHRGTSEDIGVCIAIGEDTLSLRMLSLLSATVTSTGMYAPYICLVQRGKHGAVSESVLRRLTQPEIASLPSTIYPKHVVEFRLVVAAATRAVNLLDGRPRRKGGLVRRHPHHRPVLAVQCVDVYGPGRVDLVPLQPQRRVLGDCRSGQPGER